MTKITKEEVIKLAKISCISLEEHEIPRLTRELGEILNYASGLKEIAAGKQVYPMPQNINIMREDKVIKTDPEPLLKLAPEREENYFVVPVIIKQS
jgi:aspartyl-tRNA(Asn)/glutamyl-tRNA(Gln) amidotransferase subunit C